MNKQLIQLLFILLAATLYGARSAQIAVTSAGLHRVKGWKHTRGYRGYMAIHVNGKLVRKGVWADNKQSIPRKGTHRGYNMVVINRASQKIVLNQGYDTYGSRGRAQEFEKQLKKYFHKKDDYDIALAVQDSANRLMTFNSKMYIRKLGGKLVVKVGFRTAYAFLWSNDKSYEQIGYKSDAAFVSNYEIPVIYSQCDYKGDIKAVPHDLKKVTKNIIKSIRIPEGQIVHIHQMPEFQGKKVEFTRSVECLSDVDKHMKLLIQAGIKVTGKRTLFKKIIHLRRHLKKAHHPSKVAQLRKRTHLKRNHRKQHKQTNKTQ